MSTVISSRKIAFFDIDGTLIDYHGSMPESAAEAIRGIHRKGNLTFIATGRTRARVRDPKLLSLPFDGIISGAGTLIEMGGRDLFYHRLSANELAWAIRVSRAHGLRPMLEGRLFQYLDIEEFADDPGLLDFVSDLGDRRRPIAGLEGQWEASKLTCVCAGGDAAGAARELSERFEVIDLKDVLELIPLGFSKGLAMERVCRALDIPTADSYAFGDGANDVPMLRSAGTAIVMGDGQDAAKAAADYVTSPLAEDGIRNACLHFGLM